MGDGFMWAIFWAQQFREYIPTLVMIQAWCEKMFEDKYEFMEIYRYSGYCSIPQEEWDKCIAWWKELDVIEDSPENYKEDIFNFNLPRSKGDKIAMGQEEYRKVAKQACDELENRHKYVKELEQFLGDYLEAGRNNLRKFDKYPKKVYSPENDKK